MTGIGTQIVALIGAAAVAAGGVLGGSAGGGSPDALTALVVDPALARDGRELVERYDRLYVPRNDPRYLRRNALLVAGNVGGAEHRPVLARFAGGDDDLLSEQAEWSLARLTERGL